MSSKVQVTRRVFPEVLDYLGRHLDVSDNQQDVPLGAEGLARQLADKDGAIVAISDRIDDDLLARCPRLKVVSNIAVGYNNIDIDACSRRGIMVTNTPGVLDDATADFTFALMLATARRLCEAERHLRAGRWDGWRLEEFLGADVHHATLGILGMGRIGQAVARRARGFEMTVLYHNRNRLPPAVEQECRATHVGFDELFARSDILVVMTPYSPATHHLVDAAALARLRPNAILVNTARGGVIDDGALIEALKARRVAAAGLDVFEGEPAFDRRFLELDNLVLTPHVASASAATRRRMAMLAAENLVAALTTGQPPNLVNAKAVTRPRSN
jgi:gluconate 2-dehydrogenase